WDGPGNPPGHAGCLVSPEIVSRHTDRVRKREARRKEAAAAKAQQSEADRALRARLIEACHGNCARASALGDVAPLKLARELGSLGRVLEAIRYQTDKKMYPQNLPAKAWGEERLLKAVAEHYCRCDVVPRLVEAWSAAGRAQPTRPQSPPAG